MSDPRTTPANARVAAAHLAHCSDSAVRVAGTARRIGRPVADLLREPDGPRDRQLLLGEAVTVYEDRDGWSFVQAGKDGYVGYVLTESLGPEQAATHRVTAPATHVYARADIKSADRMTLSLGSLLAGRAETGGFLETGAGFVPLVHVAPVAELAADPVAVAELFLGTPYLWGGNSRFGIDCSGLVQAALLACGLPCPGDSDQQQAALGRALPGASAARRGDLLFWAGHVALVAGPGELIHANAFHMAVSREPIVQAKARIAAQGGGRVLAHKRL
ncbi:MAG: C40 family peptidase [Jhaorihella sp.]